MSGSVQTSAAARGLSAAEVEERRRAGRANLAPPPPSRTVGQIVRANVVTPVNVIIGSLFAVIMLVRPGPDGLFAGVVVSNSVIGVVQELRAKRTLDRLALLSAPKARVIRDGMEHQVQVHEVVADDLLALSPGDQVVVDGRVSESTGLELNESLLTGESEPVEKDAGDEVLSGSFVAAGSGAYVAVKVGGESYAATLAEEARRFQLARSELQQGINRILRWLVWVIPPAAALLLLSLRHADEGWRDSIVGVVAASVAMVPDGLVLLTSVSLIVGALSLARRRALAKELASVELLARVDVLCLDKTGTITTGAIRFSGVEALPGGDEAELRQALRSLAASDPNPNATLAAVAAGLEAHGPVWRAGRTVPFSSARKWSAAAFEGHGVWLLGAPEILAAGAPAVLERVAEHAAEGRRVVLAAHAPHADLPDEAALLEGLAPGAAALLEGLAPVGLVLLEDEVRADAPEIMRFFAEQGLTLKVISGDHPTTVAAVARRAGIAGAEVGVDARTLPEDPAELAARLDEATVFGRVTPHQKRAMVAALQQRGHVVAMTGDGVNDVLALKDADMGIAMGSGAPATRAVAQLVLLDDSFATLPSVLAEGRRVIRNIERVANLFVTKTSYAVLLAVLTGLTQAPFLFLPRHLTLVGTFSIGVPGFFLALEPSRERSRPGFVGRVLRFAAPAGAVCGVATFVSYETIRRADSTTLQQAQTSAVFVLLGLALVVIALVSRPIRVFHAAIIAAMAAGYGVVVATPYLRRYFALELPPAWAWEVILAAWALGGGALAVIGEVRARLLAARTP
ncbi:MAG: HAD-IC family P-type ATPase [Acidimicrobiales bacterium]